MEIKSCENILKKIKFDRDSVGVGLITCNAEHRILQSSVTVPKWVKNFVIVNDGRPYDKNHYPSHSHVIQHETNLGVGISKNSAVEYLMSKNCEHIFLIEDDIIIKDENVFEKYVEYSFITGIKHLNFALHGTGNKNGQSANPTLVVSYPNEDIKIALYNNCVGAFSYYHRKMFEEIGYFDTNFKNAWEHVEHTYQIIKKGYHPPFWYFADIHESWNFLEEIPNSLSESIIRNSPTWNKNVSDGSIWYKNKHGIYPSQTPLASENEVNKILEEIYKHRTP
jgi:hypothetical protein